MSDVAQELSQAYCEFLYVAFQQIIYRAQIYDHDLFERRQYYGLPVSITRHPLLQKYLQDLVAQLQGKVSDQQIDLVRLAILTD